MRTESETARTRDPHSPVLDAGGVHSPDTASHPPRSARPARGVAWVAATPLLVVMLAGAAVGTLVGGVLVATRSQNYTAHAYVLVAPAAGTSGDLTGVNLAQAFARVVADPAVAGPAMRAAGLPAEPQDIAAISGTASPDAPLIDVSADNSSASRSAAVANAAAAGLITHVGTIGSIPGFRLVVLTPATVPTAPNNSTVLIYMLLSIAGGVVTFSAARALLR